MELIKTLTDKDVFGEELPSTKPQLNNRKSVKGIVRNEKGQIAMVYFDKAKFHMLPGGKIDSGESTEEALKRECLEEIGYDVEVKGQIGRIVDYKYWMNQRNTTYCYTAKIVGNKHEIRLTKEEMTGGNATTIWFDSIEEAMKAHSKDDVSDKLWRNIQYVQLELLKEAKKYQEAQ